MFFPILGPSSLPIVVAQLCVNKQLLCWSDMTDTEHYNLWFKRRRNVLESISVPLGLLVSFNPLKSIR